MKRGVIRKEQWGDGSICLIAALLLVAFQLVMRFPPFVLEDPRLDKIAVGLTGLTIGLPLLITSAIAFVITLLRTISGQFTSTRILGIVSLVVVFVWIFAPR